MKWVSIFKYLRTEYGEKIAKIEDTTQRVSFVNNINGNKVRVRFSNKFEDNSMTIEKAVIGKEAGDTAVLTLNGKSQIVLEPNAEIFSDAVDFEVKAGDKLFVDLYLKEKAELSSFCCYWSKGGTEVSFIPGDGTNAGYVITADFINEDPNSKIMSSFMGFDSVQVFADDETKVVAAFGDSITHMSFYTDALYKRICKECPGAVALINAGIGGNRLVDDATFVPEIGKRLVLFGEAGVKRFEKDVFENDEEDAVCALIGINDIMHPLQLEGKTETTSSEAIIEGYKKIIACAHNNGAEIYMGTIMPSWNEQYPAEWLPKFEKTRNEVNAWIRKCEMHDGVIDFDKALRDEKDNTLFQEGCHIGDGLHPNTEGGVKMADTVDLKTIICPRER